MTQYPDELCQEGFFLPLFTSPNYVVKNLPGFTPLFTGEKMTKVLIDSRDIVFFAVIFSSNVLYWALVVASPLKKGIFKMHFLPILFYVRQKHTSEGYHTHQAL